MFARLSPVTLVAATIAVWRLTHLFWGEDGPGDVFVRLRRCAGEGFWGSLLDCFYCLSLWISAPIAWLIGGTWFERGLLWLAFSGGAILLERATTRGSTPAPVPILRHEPPSADERSAG